MNPRLSSKRQILFNGEKTVDSANDETTEKAGKYSKLPPKQRQAKDPDPIKAPLEPQGSPQDSSKAIWLWLENNRKFIKITAVCKEAGYDIGNFSRLKKIKGQIPSEYSRKIVQILKRFGYAE